MNSLGYRLITGLPWDANYISENKIWIFEGSFDAIAGETHTGERISTDGIKVYYGRKSRCSIWYLPEDDEYAITEIEIVDRVSERCARQMHLCGCND